MAVLGIGGKLVLQRDPPRALVVSPAAHHVASNSIGVSTDGFISGDLVSLASNRGVPIPLNGVAQCPDGHAMYKDGTYDVTTNRNHVSDDLDTFYATNTDDFYAQAPLTQSWVGYVYVNQLGRLSFYDTYADAINGETANRLDIGNVDWGTLIIAPGSSDSDYLNSLVECATDIGDYEFSDAQDEVTLESICDDAPDYAEPAAGTTEYDDADINPRDRIVTPNWKTVCDLREWSLNLDANSIDTTVVGEKFGQAVKSVVSGGGTLDFLIERRIVGSTKMDTAELLRLLTLTEQGGTANAEFWMIEDRDGTGELQAGELYYDAKIMLTNVAINLRPTEVVAGTASFVTTGDIQLKMGTN